jgi:hypothetical protein
MLSTVEDVVEHVLELWMIVLNSEGTTKGVVEQCRILWIRKKECCETLEVVMEQRCVL